MAFSANKLFQRGKKTRGKQPYLIHVLKGIDDVIRKAGQQVNDEPSLQVVHANKFWIRDYFSTGTNECRVEVEDDVYQEDDIHYAVQHQPNNVILLGLERNIVGHHDCSVKSEDEDDPVPGGLEGAVVKDDMRRRLWGFLLILWENIGVELQNLEAGKRERKNSTYIFIRFPFTKH